MQPPSSLTAPNLGRNPSIFRQGLSANISVGGGLAARALKETFRRQARMAGILPGIDPRQTAATAALALALALPVQASDLTKTAVGTSPSPGGNPNPVSPISNAPGGNLASATLSNVANGKVCVLVGLRTICGTPHEFFMASSRACATSQP